MNTDSNTATITRDIVSEDWRLPIVPEGHIVLFTEPGRVLDQKSKGGNYDVCYRAYSYRVTADRPDGLATVTLRVKHGGGEESLRLCYAKDPIVTALGALSSDDRYFMLHALREQASNAAKDAQQRVDRTWRQAAADKRIRTRKVRNENQVKVWIEAAPVAAAA